MEVFLLALYGLTIYGLFLILQNQNDDSSDSDIDEVNDEILINDSL